VTSEPEGASHRTRALFAVFVAAQRTLVTVFSGEYFPARSRSLDGFHAEGLLAALPQRTEMFLPFNPQRTELFVRITGSDMGSFRVKVFRLTLEDGQPRGNAFSTLCDKPTAIHA